MEDSFGGEQTPRCSLNTAAATGDRGHFPLKPHCHLLCDANSPGLPRPKPCADADSGRRSVGLRIRVIVVGPPERREVPAEVQFEVARDAVTDAADLGTARLRTWQGQQWEEQVDAGLKLGSCWPPEPIDLGLRRGQRFTIERSQTPDERIDKRVEVFIVQRAVHPAISLGDISIEIVTAKDDLKRARAAYQTREPFQRSAARDQSDADLGVAEQGALE